MYYYYYPFLFVSFERGGLCYTWSNRFFSSADEFPFMRPDNRKWNVRVYITIGVSFNFISRRIDSNLALSTLSTRDNFR